jgi:hypothetical protein
VDSYGSDAIKGAIRVLARTTYRLPLHSFKGRQLKRTLAAGGLQCKRTDQTGEHTREQPRLNLPICDHENLWETVETIDLWVAGPKSVG